MQDKDKLNTPVFQDTTLSDLFKYIYTSTQDNKEQMKKHINKVSSTMDTVTNISIYSGLLIQYMRTIIKNDQQILKMTDIITSLINKSSKQIENSNVNQIKITQQQKKKILQGLNVQVQDLIKNSVSRNNK